MPYWSTATLSLRNISWHDIKAPLLSFLLALAVLLATGQIARQYTNYLTEKVVQLENYEEETNDLTEKTAQPKEYKRYINEKIASIPETPSPPKVDIPSEPTWLEYRIKRNDNMAKILSAINAKDDIRNALLTQKLKTHRRLRPKQAIFFQLDKDGYLSALLYKTSASLYLTAGYDETTATPWVKEAAPTLKTHQRRVSGKIESSLFAAADKAGMSDTAINALIEALESQIDFYRDVRKNDSFRTVYEEFEDEYGERAPGNIRILAFEYINHRTNKPRVIRGIRFDDDNNYYAPDGASLQGAFLPAPLKYRRISSKFSNRRLHPVLKKWRPHRGVDYAAPTGTPVRSTADGTIIKVAKERGYGKVIFIKHFNKYTTVYAHLSKFAKGIRRGKRVLQGQTIGYVGQTGLATGPHLHYEFRINNKHKDPLTVAISRKLPPLKGEALDNFHTASEPRLAALNAIPVL